MNVSIDQFIFKHFINIYSNLQTFDWYYLLLTFPYTLFGPMIPLLAISYVAKCIPIIYLIMTIMNNRTVKRFDYSRKIAAGLLASVIGDVYILNMEEVSRSYLIYGIISFALVNSKHFYNHDQYN